MLGLGSGKKLQSGGRSSEKLTDSPSFTQVSVVNIMCSSREEKKSFNRNVLFDIDLALIKAMFRVMWECRPDIVHQLSWTLFAMSEGSGN